MISSDYTIKKIELCATMQVKNIYTSSNLYNADILPKEMGMILARNENYYDKYQYILVKSDSNKENGIRPTKPKTAIN